MSTDEQQARQEWRSWHEERIGTVAAPYGPLSLMGTHWLSDYPDGRIPAVPGRWREEGGGVLLTATPEDGLSIDGKPLTGEVRLMADRGPIDGARVAHGARRLVVLSREGLLAVRDFDPASPARQAFRTIEATPYDPGWVLPGTFRPYLAERTVRVGNADGVERGLGLGGEITFEVEGAAHTLQAAVEPDGSLWVVFADATSGGSSYRFRFLRPAPPAEDGRVSVDFNRALLPPCAFADHFICPFPPPGNTLSVPVPASERNRIDA
ncbi:DUF1684 domain-containing protein [Streptomyces fulvorobeus]|uniref:DUF1684 domain-containing protein n=1 Tax=Streptomyces fulvorobeus TaxID=284028 RepID=A0A7J0C2J0_9ACTN|nr:DUF1684 domain-containing protein [Streptomyces fulvorobeus]NYE39999.1 hypothetical protein [Streptomyces fulvorobeus]GFM96257.1 hypothetical protein Sfulv_10680 [Streptomyces fulvorobeus]